MLRHRFILPFRRIVETILPLYIYPDTIKTLEQIGLTVAELQSVIGFVHQSIISSERFGDSTIGLLSGTNTGSDSVLSGELVGIAQVAKNAISILDLGKTSDENIGDNALSVNPQSISIVSIRTSEFISDFSLTLQTTTSIHSINSHELIGNSSVIVSGGLSVVNEGILTGERHGNAILEVSGALVFYDTGNNFSGGIGQNSLTQNGLLIFPNSIISENEIGADYELIALSVSIQDISIKTAEIHGNNQISNGFIALFPVSIESKEKFSFTSITTSEPIPIEVFPEGIESAERVNGAILWVYPDKDRIYLVRKKPRIYRVV